MGIAVVRGGCRQRIWPTLQTQGRDELTNSMCGTFYTINKTSLASIGGVRGSLEEEAWVSQLLNTRCRVICYVAH